MRLKRQRQRPIKGGRDPIYSSIHPKVRELIERDARKFNVFPSFVAATALEAFYRKHFSEHFYDVDKRKK